jgi:ADP-heptose:LPS heptosyltransferase
METHLPGASVPQRIVILRALQLGDNLCAVPAWRALRSAYPQTHITLIGLPWAESFVRRFHHLVDELLIFPGLPGFPEREPDIQAFPVFLSQAQQQRYDLALQMQGSGGLSNSLVMLFGARQAAGFYLPGQYCPDSRTFCPYPEQEPEVWRHLRLMQYLGIPLQGEHLEFPLTQQDWQELHSLPEVQALGELHPGRYALLHPGARAPERRWLPEHFARVGQALVQQGLQVIITGTAQERPLAEAVEHVMRQNLCLTSVGSKSALPVQNLAGRTSLGALAALLSTARLLVTNDTGVSHLAAALQVPSLVLFLASDPRRWAPLNHDLHRPVIAARQVDPQAELPPVDRIIAMALEQAQKFTPRAAATLAVERRLETYVE